MDPLVAGTWQKFGSGFMDSQSVLFLDALHVQAVTFSACSDVSWKSLTLSLCRWKSNVLIRISIAGWLSFIMCLGPVAQLYSNGVCPF